MTNVSIIQQFSNTGFSPAFGEYLTAAGFSVAHTSNKILFSAPKKQVYIECDQVFFYEYKPEIPGPARDKWVFHSSFSGVSKLTIFTWMQLMQLMGVVTVSEFLEINKRGGMQQLTEAASLVEHYSRLTVVK